MKFNVENCDVIMENGFLRLIYHTDKMAVPLVLAACKSYHDLNEKAMKILGKNKWAEDVVEWSIREESPVWHNLLADIYKNHYDLYESIVGTQNEDEESETPKNYVEVLDTGEKDERGHRIGRLNYTNLTNMDFDMLRALGHDFGIEDVDLLGPNDLAYSISLQEIDMDDTECDHNCSECECSEMTDNGNCICHYDEDKSEDEDTENEYDGNCEHCKYDAPESDSGCSCNSNENETPRQFEAQPEALQYEYVNGPDHYNGTQCIEQMRHLYGDEAVKWFCICNAYKYRFRNGHKPGVTAEQDEQKARWYEDYASNMMSAQRYY